MSSQRRWQVWWSLCVVLALLCKSADAVVNENQPVVVNYNTRLETAYTDVIPSQSFYSANALCMANGMNLFSAERDTRQDRFYVLVANQVSSAVGYSGYTSISAMKTAENVRCTYTNTNAQFGASTAPSPFYCQFSIQWGLFSRVTIANAYANQPGMPVYNCVYRYYLDGSACGAKSLFMDSVTWDASNPAIVHPNGKNFTVLYTGATRASISFANIDAAAPADYYLPVAKFITVCEAQSNLGYPVQTFTATQPSFVKGYKELTWVQKHWWVLFLIIAVVILIVLFIILIFCCMTSIPPKEGPPIAPMVLRERNGNAYVNASDDDDSTPKSRGLDLDNINQGNSIDGEGQEHDGMQHQTHQNPPADMMMMMPMPVVDPEDLIQATPSIYSQEDVQQTAEGDSLASDEDDSNLSEEDERR